MSTLFIPLSLAALGIVLRGAGFAFPPGAEAPRAATRHERAFAVSSVVTPFFMGTVVGASRRDGCRWATRQGDAVTSWLNASPCLSVSYSWHRGLSRRGLPGERRPRYGDPDSSATSPARWRRRRAGVIAVAGDLRCCATTPATSTTASPVRVLPCRSAPRRAASPPWRCYGGGSARSLRLLAVGAVVAVIWGWGRGAVPLPPPPEAHDQRTAGPGDAHRAARGLRHGRCLRLSSAWASHTLAQRSILEKRGEAATRAWSHAVGRAVRDHPRRPAISVEVGGGLRITRSTAATCSMATGKMRCRSGRGQVLAPGRTGVFGTAATNRTSGPAPPAPPRQLCEQDAIHGLVRWVTLGGRREQN